MNPLADKFISAYLCKLCIKTCKRSKTRRFKHVVQKGTQQKILSPGMGKRGFMIITIVNKGEVDFTGKKEDSLKNDMNNLKASNYISLFLIYTIICFQLGHVIYL